MQTQPDQLGLWTIEEYADYWKVSRATVYNWLARGWLDSVKIGALRRIRREDDVAFRARAAKGHY